MIGSCWPHVGLKFEPSVCHCQTESFEVFGFVCSFEEAPAGCTDTAKLMVTLVISPIGISRAYLFRTKSGPCALFRLHVCLQQSIIKKTSLKVPSSSFVPFRPPKTQDALGRAIGASSVKRTKQCRMFCRLD